MFACNYKNIFEHKQKQIQLARRTKTGLQYFHIKIQPSQERRKEPEKQDQNIASQPTHNHFIANSNLQLIKYKNI